MRNNKKFVRTLIRLSLGFIFLWAFWDKLFGLSYSTAPDRSWLDGVSPTKGFLVNATSGPFAGFFKDLAGQPIVDWLFMLGLLGIGLALILGLALRLAATAGSIMMILIWLAAFPPQNNPFVDEHIIYSLILIGLAKNDAETYWSLNKWWSKTGIPKKLPFLA